MRPLAWPLLSVLLGIGTLLAAETSQAQTPGPPPKVTLSGEQLRLVSASVNEAGAAAAIDGNTGTDWEVSGGWPQEIVLELPDLSYVTALRYIHGSRTTHYLTQYRIYASEDGKTWINTSAPGAIKNTALVWEIRLSWPKHARYVKLVYLGSGGGDRALTAEINVVSAPYTPPPSVTPLPAPTSAAPVPPPSACFTLGGEDLPKAGYDVNTLWNQHGMSVTSLSDSHGGARGALAPMFKGDVARGLGIQGGALGEIEQGEGVVVHFGGAPQRSLDVGLRQLYKEGSKAVPAPPDGVETASWAAYRGGVVVASGTVDAVENPGTRGKATFAIDVPEGFDQIAFFSEERGSDFSLEFVRAMNHGQGCGFFQGSPGGSSEPAGGGHTGRDGSAPASGGTPGAAASPTMVSGQVCHIPARFFQTKNTWYEKIPATMATSPHSSHYVNDILLNSRTLIANTTEWSVPVWQASADTPYVTVQVNSATARANGWHKVPIPAKAVPAGNDAALKGHYRDGHMVVLSADGRYAWDFFGAKKRPNGQWTATTIRRWDRRGSGGLESYDRQGSARACPTSLLNGLITQEEFKKGSIEHALAFAYWGAPKKAYTGVYPCKAYRQDVSDRPWAIPDGTRLQLDPSVNIDALGLNCPGGKMVAKALQQYGMIMVDNCGPGCNSIYAESLVGKNSSWGNAFSCLNKIPLNKLRVIAPIRPSSGSTNICLPE
jgi:hypothetical protein